MIDPMDKSMETGEMKTDASAQAGTSLACLSIDVEEYFHCEAFARRVRPSDWQTFERRAAPRLERIAELLEQHRSKATFFVLGWSVEHMTPLLRELIRRGHEIASHGDGHAHLARMSPESLREDLKRACGRIEDALGVRPLGYRAPTFSITRRTAWALDVLIQQGFEYDSSIFPIRHDRYGVRSAPVRPFWAVAPSGTPILEFPPLTLDFKLARIPLGGGGYLRLLPDFLLHKGIRWRLDRAEPVMIYLHPWELDPDQPLIDIGPLANWRHRVNLHTTERKLSHLLSAIRFDTAAAVLEHVKQSGRIPRFELVPKIAV